MNFVSRLLRRMRVVIWKREADAEMTEQIRHHLELQAADYLARGLSPDEARAAAQRSFGHVEGIKEEIREQRGLPLLETVVQDFGYGFRILRKSPGFTAITVLTLALGIGATTAIFTIVNSVILQPLPYRQADRVLALREVFRPKSAETSASRVSFRFWKEQLTSFESLATAAGWARTITGLGEPVRLYGWRVSPNYFTTLGIQPILGRVFTPDESIEGKGDVILISHRLWLGRFNGRADIIGQQVRIDDQSYTIVGVLPKNFLPETVTDPAFFAPEPDTLGDQSRFPRFVEVIGRLKDGVTKEQAGQELDAIAARIALEHPETNRDWGARVVPVLEVKTRDVKSFLFLLLGAVGFLLLIACVNVANLLLARASSRAKEMAVRTALGASRRRIIGQLLCESLMISLAGSAIGVALAHGGLSLLLDSAPLALPRAREISVDGWVLLFSCSLAIVTGIGFGLVPALQASRVNPQDAIRESGRGNSSGGKALRLRSTLVALEVSLALVLLVAAGLLLHSFARLQKIPLGYRIQSTYVAKNTLPNYRYPTDQSRIAFVNQAVERLSAVPGVHSVVFASYFPAFGGNDRLYSIAGRADLDPRNLPPAGFVITTPDFFRALNIPLRQGRLLEPRDTADTQPVAVVSQGFADKYFPRQNPLGQRITMVDSPTISREIVGVVESIHDRGPLVDRPFQIYAPFAQAPFPTPAVIIRVDAKLAGTEHALRQAMGLVDPDMPLTLVGIDLTGFLNETIAPQRFALFLFATFAAVSLLLSALGIYGVVAYSVIQRTQEIGIRMALGAQARDILALIFSQTGRMVGVGVALGLIASLATTRFLNTLLVEISAYDPVAFLVVPLFLALVAMLACWLPARRATKVDPLVALRHE